MSRWQINLHGNLDVVDIFVEASHTRRVCEQIMLFCDISAQTPSWTSISVNLFWVVLKPTCNDFVATKGFTIYKKTWKLCCTNIKMGKKKLLFRVLSNAIWFTIHVNVTCTNNMCPLVSTYGFIHFELSCVDKSYEWTVNYLCCLFIHMCKFPSTWKQCYA